MRLTVLSSSAHARAISAGVRCRSRISAATFCFFVGKLSTSQRRLVEEPIARRLDSAQTTDGTPRQSRAPGRRAARPALRFSSRVAQGHFFATDEAAERSRRSSRRFLCPSSSFFQPVAQYPQNYSCGVLFHTLSFGATTIATLNPRKRRLSACLWRFSNKQL